MMAVILAVLRILGIAILSLLALIFLLILLVLFVPVRYRISANKSNDEMDSYRIEAKFSYLLHIVNGKFSFPAENKLRIRLFSFTIFPKKQKTLKTKKASKKYEKECDDKDENKERSADAEDDAPSIDELEEIAKSHDFNIKAETVRSIAHEINEEAIDDNPTIRKFIDKIIDFIKNIKDRLLTIGQKIKDIHNNICYYLDILSSELFKKSWNLCKSEFIKLIKAVKPEKVKGMVHFGSEDPSTVGMIYGLYSTVFPRIGKDIVLMPHFEEKVFTADIFLKGKVTVFSLLIIAVKIYFNKDIKRTLKLLKREK